MGTPTKSDKTTGGTSPVRIPAHIFGSMFSACIGGGMLLCLLIALNSHYDGVIRTHCKNWQFWPSVSSCIGDYWPEKSIWRVAIGLGSGPRLVTVFLNYNTLKEAFGSEKALRTKAVYLIDWARVLAAGGWTYISSSEDNDIHSLFFVIYVLGSFAYSILYTPLFYEARIKRAAVKDSAEYQRFVMSYRLKLACCLIQIGCVPFLAYTHVLHNEYCTPGAYSFYAIFEWILSAANIFYDHTFYFDYQGVFWTLFTSTGKQE
eukprot:TRINITY_DN4810_c0_g1_i1.p1 TRINITY_DN4810_c0_g1~~TRINITY_DN4810_c0_g1_i1.p1  ORF type:complete len:261 (-),score=99.49 TRINITY_DN4810_c0_g1_i1:287-1069(-)